MLVGRALGSQSVLLDYGVHSCSADPFVVALARVQGLTVVTAGGPAAVPRSPG
jgi:hypothetical protein